MERDCSTFLTLIVQILRSLHRTRLDITQNYRLNRDTASADQIKFTIITSPRKLLNFSRLCQCRNSADWRPIKSIIKLPNRLTGRRRTGHTYWDTSILFTWLLDGSIGGGIIQSQASNHITWPILTNHSPVKSSGRFQLFFPVLYSSLLQAVDKVPYAWRNVRDIDELIEITNEIKAGTDHGLLLFVSDPTWNRPTN